MQPSSAHNPPCNNPQSKKDNSCLASKIGFPPPQKHHLDCLTPIPTISLCPYLANIRLHARLTSTTPNENTANGNFTKPTGVLEENQANYRTTKMQAAPKWQLNSSTTADKSKCTQKDHQELPRNSTLHHTKYMI